MNRPRVTVKLDSPVPGLGRFVTPILALLLGLSLALHAWTLFTLLRTRTLVREEFTTLATQLAQIEGSTPHFSIPVRQNVPIQASVPINRQLTVPISTTVPIRQTVAVSLDTPVGAFPVNVPLNMDIPIRLEVPVTLSETLQINTTVALDVPLELNIPIQETALADYLRQLRQRLIAITNSL